MRADGVAFNALAAEHPTLTGVVSELLSPLRAWSEQLRAVEDGSVWLHHSEFADRTEQLAAHLVARPTAAARPLGHRSDVDAAHVAA